MRNHFENQGNPVRVKNVHFYRFMGCISGSGHETLLLSTDNPFNIRRVTLLMVVGDFRMQSDVKCRLLIVGSSLLVVVVGGWVNVNFNYLLSGVAW